MNKSRQVIVSGATGFIGRHLVPLLLNQNYEVIAIARNKTYAEQLNWYKHVRFIPYDFHGDAYFPAADHGSSLIHLAWQGLPNYDSSIHINNNLPASFKFIQNLVSRGIQHVLVTGTCLEYGFKNGPIPSLANPDPINSYAIAKDRLRAQLALLNENSHFLLQWARLFYLHGEGQSSNSILPQLDTAIDQGSKIFNMSGGHQIRDYLAIEQAAQQILDLFLSHRSGTFNICSGNPISINELVEKHIKSRSSNIKLNRGFYPYTDYEPMSFWGVRDIGQTIYLPPLPNAPLESSFICETLAPMRLAYNQQLNFLQNAAFDKTLIDYSNNYENSQGYSQRFQSHMKDVLAILKSTTPEGGKIVEIGCGKGDFVELVQADKYFQIEGYDSAYSGTNRSIHCRYLTVDDRIHADIIVLRHVLEHIQHPYKFLDMIKTIFGKAKIYIEVPCYEWIIKNGAFFDITYEHVNYFSETSLKNLFMNGDTNYGLLFEEQYHYIISEISSLNVTFNESYESNDWSQLTFDNLFPDMSNDIDRISRLAFGKSAYLWGSGTKGCLFLSHCANAGKLISNIKFAIDINPQKIGKFLPGSMIEIKSKVDFFSAAKSGDVLIISNPNYQDEIIKEIRSAGLNDIFIETL